jgi:RNase P/RNase MRP subunit POP5
MSGAAKHLPVHFPGPYTRVRNIKMVRVKNRYLVVNYLYPTAAGQSNPKDALPGALQFHQPTPDEFHQGKLLRAIQEGIAELFGEYGMGMVSTSLKSRSQFYPNI